MDDLRYQVDLLNAMNERIKADEEMYRLVCETSWSALLYINIKKGTCKMLGDWNSYFEGVSINNINDISKLYSFIEEQSVLLFRDLLYLDDSGKNTQNSVFKFKNENKYIDCRVNVVYSENGEPKEKVIRFSDVTKFKAQNDELLYMAYNDILTGLYNRNYFVKLLSDYIRKAEEENAIVSVMFIDLDDFHTINDGMGMVIGDELVQTIGFFLNKFKKDNVLISHFNADIYCIAIYEPNNSINADIIYRELTDFLKEPIELSNKSKVSVSFCAGVADYPESSTNTLELINCAEIVMFKAKKRGRGHIQYFDAPILKEFLNNVSIENKLKSAVFEQNFIMYFQPQYFAESKKLRGVEALIRWKDNDGHMISPGLFIPIAEKNGTIIPIGSWVIEESLRLYAAWGKKFSYDFKLSLNISAIQYRADDFVTNIIKLIRQYELDPKNIELEITESIFIDDFKDVYDKLILLREYGIQISLDDFGTGYSSLSYLKGLPIDTLKIDKSFVDSINNDENSRIILETIIFMSKKLGYETIAEGVEDSGQYEYIKNIGCDCIQGYYLGHPMNKDGIESLLRDKYF